MPVSALPAHAEWLIRDGRDLEIWDFFYPDRLEKGPAFVREARAALDGYRGRLGIHGPTEGLPLVCLDPRVRALVADRLKQALDCAAALGATQMVVHSPFRFFGNPHVAHSPGRGLAGDLQLAHALLDGILPLARQADCCVVVENCYDRNTGPLMALVRSFDSPWLQASLDTGHAQGMAAVGGPPPDQWVRDAGSALAHLHLQDTDGHGDRHWAPGDGDVNWFAVFEALNELAHDPRLILEIDRPERIRAGAEHLARMGLAR
jgi:sugar phosphate isomerase/epimerase